MIFYIKELTAKKNGDFKISFGMPKPDRLSYALYFLIKCMNQLGTRLGPDDLVELERKFMEKYNNFRVAHPLVNPNRIMFSYELDKSHSEALLLCEENKKLEIMVVIKEIRLSKEHKLFSLVFGIPDINNLPVCMFIINSLLVLHDVQIPQENCDTIINHYIEQVNEIRLKLFHIPVSELAFVFLYDTSTNEVTTRIMDEEHKYNPIK